MDKFVDEYCGWCEFLNDTHRQWTVVLQQDLTAENLAAYPIVVLPSVITLTDAQIGELCRYVTGGGRLVATGLTGTRYGPERYLAPRGERFAVPGARIVSDKPGVTYWRSARHCCDATSNGTDRLARVPPRLATDAPGTVGVNLNVNTDAAAALLTLDLNNCDIVVETDTIRPAPVCTTTIHLPDSWRGHDVQASYVTPEMSPDASPVPMVGDDAVVDREAGTLRIRTPAFETFTFVFGHIRE